MLTNERTVRATAYTAVGVVNVKATVYTKRSKKVDHLAHVQRYCRWLIKNFT